MTLIDNNRNVFGSLFSQIAQPLIGSVLNQLTSGNPLAQAATNALMPQQQDQADFSNSASGYRRLPNSYQSESFTNSNGYKETNNNASWLDDIQVTRQPDPTSERVQALVDANKSLGGSYPSNSQPSDNSWLSEFQNSMQVN